jgi:hypothetical protein
MQSFKVPYVAAGTASVSVSDPRITTKSFVSVILTSEPGNSTNGRPTVSWISVQSGKFIVNFSQKLTKRTSFNYFFVELCPPGVA